MKNLEDYQTYMDESSKFQELKSMKDAANKLLVKGVLEQQIDHDR